MRHCSTSDNADDPHPLVAVSSSQGGNLGFAPPCIQWIFPDSIRHNNVKYARWGTNYLYKIHQTSIRNPDRILGSKYVTKLSSHQFYQTQIKTRNGLCVLVHSAIRWRYIRNHKLFIGLQWIGHILWHLISYCLWSYNSLWFDTGLSVSAKTCTAIAGGFDDEEQVQSTCMHQ